MLFVLAKSLSNWRLFDTVQTHAQSIPTTQSLRSIEPFSPKCHLTKKAWNESNGRHMAVAYRNDWLFWSYPAWSEQPLQTTPLPTETIEQHLLKWKLKKSTRCFDQSACSVHPFISNCWQCTRALISSNQTAKTPTGAWGRGARRPRPLRLKGLDRQDNALGQRHNVHVLHLHL